MVKLNSIEGGFLKLGGFSLLAPSLSATYVVSDLSVCLEQCSTVYCLLLDFAKVFDLLLHYHEHLLLKLSSLRIHSDVL